MKRRFNRTQRNYIIAGLCMILVIMGVGYAAFQSQLKISGTSSISSSWNIQITNIETMLPSDYGSEYPDGYNISEPTYTPTSATFNAGFELPGSEIDYVVEVSNLGSIDGQVTIGNLNCGDNSAIMCQAMATDEEGTNSFNFDYGNQDYSDISFPLKVGEKHYIVIGVYYDDVTEQPTDLDANIKLDLTYEQYVDPNRPIPSGETTIIGGQEVELVSGGDGLYKDEYENGRYVYKGVNPNNYIAFGEEFDEYRVIYQGEDIGVSFSTEEECQNWLTESGAPSYVSCTLTQGYSGGLWRIIAKESDGTYKILKKELLPNQAWDTTGSFYGSNNWARPADLNSYLNGEYYENLDSSIKDNIVSHIWGIGAVTFDNNDLSAQIVSEQGTTWSGNIGLIAHSDYLRANSDMANCGTAKINYENYETCRNTNWMYIINSRWWTISPGAGYYEVLFVDSNGRLHSTDAGANRAPRPAAYLKSDITLSGSGTLLDPFKIVS